MTKFEVYYYRYNLEIIEADGLIFKGNFVIFYNEVACGRSIKGKPIKMVNSNEIRKIERV